MKIRRYYPRGSKHKYVISDEQFDMMIEKHGAMKALAIDNAQFEIIPDNANEAFEMFNDCCDRVVKDTSFYMENLDKIPTFKIKYTDIYEKIGQKTKSL